MTSVADLVAAVRMLADVDPGSLTADELEATIVELAALADAAVVVQARLLAEWDTRQTWRADGSRSASSALSARTGCSPASARRVLGRAHHLEQLPRVAEAAIDGRLSLDRLDLICSVATDDRSEVFPTAELDLIARCERPLVFDDARRSVDDWAMRTDEDLDLPKPDRATSTTSVHHHRRSGQVDLTAALSVLDGDVVRAEMLRLYRQVLADDRKSGISRTRGQRQAAALVRMASRSATAPGGVARLHIQVVAGDATMRRMCELASGTVLHRDELLGLLDAATFETFLFGERSVIVTASPSRTFRGALRRAIQVRDRRCQHLSGCDVMAPDADVDHLRPHSHGGRTDQFNGGVMCLPHNRLDLGGSKPAPRQIGPVGVLEQIRARERWRLLHQSPAEQREPLIRYHMEEVERLLRLGNLPDDDEPLELSA